jgi:hypothetical protein
MCDVPSTAVCCSKSVECFPGMASKFFLKPLLLLLLLLLLLVVVVLVLVVVVVVVVYAHIYNNCVATSHILFISYGMHQIKKDEISRADMGGDICIQNFGEEI